MNVDVVIGANFGDEGKGVITNRLCQEHEDDAKLNVLFNGGCQRGHNVKSKVLNHTFHCFGSGYFSGADTYYEKDFMIDPFGYVAESGMLSSMPVHVIANPQCQLVFVVDKAVNRAVEELRTKRHGSCGMGIFETWHRVNSGCSFTLGEWNPSVFIESQKRVKYYYDNVRIPEIAKELHISKEDVTNKVNEIIHRDGDCDYDVWYDCMNLFFENCEIDADPYQNYDYVIFEGGQGLALDMDNKKYWPHLTPSHTGVYNLVPILKRILSYGTDSLCFNYISRPYYTRHGVGILPNEIAAKDIPFILKEDINAPNPYQGALRYAPLNFDIVSRINAEKAIINSELNGTDIQLCSRIVMTHLDETGNKVFYRGKGKNGAHLITLNDARRFMGQVDVFNL